MVQEHHGNRQWDAVSSSGVEAGAEFVLQRQRSRDVNVEILPHRTEIDVCSALGNVMLGSFKGEVFRRGDGCHGPKYPRRVELAKDGDTDLMPLVLFLLLILVPIAELYVIVQVGQELGIFPTLLLLVGVSILGGYLLKREGTATWRRLRQQLAQGKVPTAEATDGALILLGGALLLTPGFLTDIVGLLLVLPVSRQAVKGVARKFMGGWLIKRMGPAGYVGAKVYQTQAGRVRRRRTPTDPPQTDSSSPLLDLPAAEDDSPDTG